MRTAWVCVAYIGSVFVRTHLIETSEAVEREVEGEVEGYQGCTDTDSGVTWDQGYTSKYMCVNVYRYWLCVRITDLFDRVTLSISLVWSSR
jgi:hypothetical protein